MVGTTIGHYRIEAETGSGGMGVVYRAVDIHLKRPVAIKVLHAGSIGDPDRRRRFVQEAQAASALNHPDIVTIYEIGTDGQTDFIAMEFVAGRSLDNLLRGRTMALADAVKFGIRIAGALAAAHRAGIVHRDLKPANVMVTDRGDIKLLDFGVAKLVEPSTEETAVAAASTRTGFIVGTLAYMSPEQAQGRKVDARSDIYSFGVLLHEMIAGRRPDAGGALALDGTPRDLRRIVARCLQQDPDRRFQVMDDVRLALEEADLTADRDPAPAQRFRRRRFVLVAAGALAAVVAAAWLGWRLKPVPVARTPVLTRLTMDSALTIDPVLSPDGRFIAFASDRSGDGNLDIWVRQVAGGAPVRLTSDPADDREPSFSPDGSQIAFRSDRDGGGVYVTSTFGGDARRIVDRCRRPRWSPAGGQIVCWAGLNTGFLISKADAPRVFVVPATGGEPRRLFSSFAVAVAPIWSADGTRLLFLGRREANDAPEWWVADADGNAPAQSDARGMIVAAGLQPGVEGVLTPDLWTADGRVLFSGRLGDATNIWSVVVARDGRAEQKPQRVTAGTDVEISPTVDSTGSLAYGAITNDVDLWSTRIDAAGMGSGGAERLTQDPAMDVYPWLSADGTTLAFVSNRSGTFDVLVRDLATGRDSVAAPSVYFPSLPSLTKDGTRVTFHGSPRWRWLSVPIPGRAGTRSTAPQVVCDGCESFWDLSSDGRWAIFGREGDTIIAVREIATGRTTDVIRAPNDIVGRLRISPDDRWVAFNDRTQGSIRITLVPFQTTSGIAREQWIPITPEDTLVNAPTWSTTGDAVYYLSDRDGHTCVWRQAIDRSTGKPSGDAVAAWHLHDPRVAISRLPLPVRGLAVSRDRIVVAVSEGAGNIWMAKER